MNQTKNPALSITTSSSTTTSSTLVKPSSESKMSSMSLQKRIRAILQSPDNQVCLDCSSPNPRWVTILSCSAGTPNNHNSTFHTPNSTNYLLGGICCLECSGAHRTLGTHIAFVRSLDLDQLKPREVDAIELGGNATINSIFEGRLVHNSNLNNNLNSSGQQHSDALAKYKPNASSDQNTREKFIREKYEKKLFFEANNYRIFRERLANQNTIDSSTTTITKSTSTSTPLSSKNKNELLSPLSIHSPSSNTMTTPSPSSSPHLQIFTSSPRTLALINKYLQNDKKKSKKNRRRENREQSDSKKSSKKKRLKKLLKSLLVNTSKDYDKENHSPTNLHSKRPITEASLVQKKYESRYTHNHDNPNHDDTSSETSSECGSVKTKSKSQFKSPLFKRHYSRRRHSNNSISSPLSTSLDENDDELSELSVHSCPLSYINPPISSHKQHKKQTDMDAQSVSSITNSITTKKSRKWISKPKKKKEDECIVPSNEPVVVTTSSKNQSITTPYTLTKSTHNPRFQLRSIQQDSIQESNEEEDYSHPVQSNAEHDSQRQKLIIDNGGNGPEEEDETDKDSSLIKIMYRHAFEQRLFRHKSCSAASSSSHQQSNNKHKYRKVSLSSPRVDSMKHTSMEPVAMPSPRVDSMKCTLMEPVTLDRVTTY